MRQPIRVDSGCRMSTSRKKYGGIAKGQTSNQPPRAEPTNQAVPEWKEGFTTIGVYELYGVGFTDLDYPGEDGRTTLKRTQNGLTMYIEQDHTAGAQTSIRVSWLYLKPSGDAKSEPRPTYVNMTRELWNDIVHGQRSNQALLLREVEKGWGE